MMINRTWANGRPSNVLHEAGVIVRHFDALSKLGPPWEPCERGWCERYKAMWPASIVNQNRNNVVYGGNGGVGLVLAPPPWNRLHCIYPGDGNSMGHVGAVPSGCQKACVMPQTWDCAFHADQLELALANTHGYNEVVVDAQYMKAQLPHSIWGIFYIAAGLESSEGAARWVHTQFLEAFGLSAQDFPLLHFSTTGGFSLAATVE